MKRVISLLTVFCMLFSIIPAVSASTIAEGTCGENLTWVLDENGHLEISGSGDMTDFGWDESVPWDTGSVTSVSIAEGVTSIGDEAFYYCINLTSVTIPDSVTSIGYRAFYNCINLTSVTIPDSVTSIDYEAFESCSSLTSVAIPDSVTLMGSEVFADCTSLTGIWVAEDNKEYSSDSHGALLTKSQDTLIQVPGGFEGSYTVPDGVTAISDNAFSGCSSLTSVIIPDSVTYVGNYAFMYCSSLTSVTIPGSVFFIGNEAFYDCTSLTGIWVSEDNKAYSSDSYGALLTKSQDTLIRVPIGIEGSYTVPDGVTSFDSEAFKSCSSLTSVTIPDSVTSIGDNVFMYCSSLTSVSIPDSVTSIGSYAFYFCSSLTSVTIPDSVTSIGYSAFYGCSSLTSVTIPDSVTTIGEDTFYYCTDLTSVTIPESVITIGEYAFYNCTDLTSVTIPDSVTSIGEYAFAYCRSLKNIYFQGNAPEIGKTAFTNVEANCYYSITDTTWTDDICTDYGGTLTWIAASDDCLEGNHIFTTYVSDDNGTCQANGTKSALCDGGCGMTDTVEEDGSIKEHLFSSYVYDSATNTSVASCIFGCGMTDTIEGIAAQELILEEEAEADVPAGGLAYFTFTPENTARFEFTSNTNMDTYGYLYDSNMSQLASNDDGGSGFNFSITYTLQAGEKYYYGVRLYSSGEATFPVLLKISHQYEESAIVSEGTCLTPGEKAFTCIYCGDTYNEAYYGDHSYVYTISKEATCQEDGEYEITCSVDGCEYFSTEPIEGDHDYVDGECRFCSKSEFVEGGSCGEGVQWELNTQTGALKIYGSGEMTNYNYSDQPWYSFNNQILSVEIQEGITHIGNYAFRRCSNLTTVSISESVTSIGNNAFYSCVSLTDVTLPENLTYLGEAAFNFCDNLSSVTIPNSLTCIENSTFADCNSLSTVNIPNSVTTIGNRAFYECDSLANIVIPDSVTTIGDYAFYDCSNLLSITIPDSVTTLGSYAFTSCDSLSSVTLSNSLTSIPYRAFANCDNLTSIIIPDGVTAIESTAFYSCTSLGDVSLPATLTSIGYEAFYNCNSLIEITLPDSLVTISESAFSSCDSLTQVELSESLQTIGNYAFSGCNALSSISIPASVTSIGSGAFMTTGFESYEIAEANESYTLVDGVLYSMDMTTLVHMPCGLTVTQYEVPEGVTNIYSGAFYNCKSLIDVTIPDSVTELGSSAFTYCKNLQYVTLPAQLSVVSAGAFFDCPSLLKISIPESVGTIGYDAFGKNNLVGIDFGQPVTVAGYSYYAGFLTCDDLQTITLPNTVESISFLSSVTKPENLRFEGDPSTEGTIRSGVTCYYPGDNEKWTEEVRNSMGTDITWIPISDDCLAGNHTFTEYVTVQEANCISTALRYSLCDDCAYVEVSNEDGELGDHDYSNYVVTVPGSCTEEGTRVYTCENCKTVFEGADPIDPKAHVYENGVCILCEKIEKLEGGICGDNATWELDKETGILKISGSGDMYDFNDEVGFEDIGGELIRPYGGYITHSITPWYEWAEYITSCEIEDGITRIGDCAFSDLKNLVSIEIPDSVVSLGKYAFNYCRSLTAVELPDNIQEIEEYTFRWCNNLDTIKLPLQLKHIDQYVFEGCWALTEINIPDQVETISEYAFYEAGGLTRIELPDSLKRIESNTFTYCESLNEVILPAGLEYISDAAFLWCYDLENVHFNGNAPEISDEAFYSVTANCYYPENDTSWDNAKNNYGGNLTWISHIVKCPDGTHVFDRRVIHEDYLKSAATADSPAVYFYSCVCGEAGEETFTIDGNTVEVMDSLNQILGQEDISEEEIKDLVQQLDADSLKAALESENHEVDQLLEELEAKVSDTKSEIQVSEIISQLRDDNISILGAALNDVVEQGKNVVLVIDEATQEVEIPDEYDNGNRITFSMTLENVQNPKELNVPVKIILPIPEEFRVESVMILHYNDDGSVKESISPNVFEEAGKMYASFVISGFSNFAMVDIHEHIPVTDKSVEPTCTETGLTEGTHCSSCGETLIAQEIVPVTAHSYSEFITAPTCTEQGYTTFTCDCGDTYDGDFVKANGHKFGNWQTSVEATTSSAGKEVRTCSVCGEKEFRDTDKLSTEPTEPSEPEITEPTTPSEPEVSEPTAPSEPENPFVDVVPGKFYELPVLWAVENGITTGTDATHFSPGDMCTRGQVVTFLWRAAGSPEPTSTENPFTDVAEKKFYYKAVLWAVENEITNGTTETTFSPNDNCTRGQVVTFLWRAMNQPSASSAENPFTDVVQGKFYYDAVLWAVEAGVTDGMGNNQFQPNGTCTRGQVVTFLYRTQN